MKSAPPVKSIFFGVVSVDFMVSLQSTILTVLRKPDREILIAMLRRQHFVNDREWHLGDERN